jgi:hypothetical protein
MMFLFCSYGVKRVGRGSRVVFHYLYQPIRIRLKRHPEREPRLLRRGGHVDGSMGARFRTRCRVLVPSLAGSSDWTAGRTAETAGPSLRPESVRRNWPPSSIAVWTRIGWAAVPWANTLPSGLENSCATRPPSQSTCSVRSNAVSIARSGERARRSAITVERCPTPELKQYPALNAYS